ncbi:MAG: hypothetical protein E7616_04355 [Ruminococcaceae bacterium]|nr:hypothetical protein [Oscillospiraceae bacterium]
MRKKKYKWEAYDDSVVIRYAEQISVKQAFKQYLPTLLLVGGVMFFIALVNLICALNGIGKQSWQHCLLFSILAFVAWGVFRMLAVADAKRSKAFHFSVNQEGIMVTERKKQYCMSWDNVAVVGMGCVSRPRSSLQYFVFFSAKEDTAQGISDKIEWGMLSDQFVAFCDEYIEFDGSEKKTIEEIYAVLSRYIDRYAPNAKRCVVDRRTYVDSIGPY